MSEETLGAAELLAAVDAGAPREGVLSQLIRSIEAANPGGKVTGSILVLEEGKLRHGAAPGLPAEYNAAIDGIEIGPGVGSCGTAAYCGHAIFVGDIANDPLWKDFKDLALAHGLRACWSMPIMATTGRVLGTFALYYRETRSPSQDERKLIRNAAEIARALLERYTQRSRQELRA